MNQTSIPYARPLPPLGPGEIPPRGLDAVVMSPTEIAGVNLDGCVAARLLADGRLLALQPLLFGCVRLCVGRPAVMVEEGALGGWDAVWDFNIALVGMVALATWDPQATDEPEGWTKCPK